MWLNAFSSLLRLSRHVKSPLLLLLLLRPLLSPSFLCSLVHRARVDSTPFLLQGSRRNLSAYLSHARRNSRKTISKSIRYRISGISTGNRSGGKGRKQRNPLPLSAFRRETRGRGRSVCRASFACRQYSLTRSSVDPQAQVVIAESGNTR